MSKKDTFADPTALGLFTFAITTFFYSVHNVGYLNLDAGIVANCLVYGGLIQFLCGLMNFKRENTFGMVAFCGYGCFWMSFAGLLIFPAYFKFEPSPDMGMSFYLVCWTLFTLFLTIAVFVNNPIFHVKQLIFTLLFLLFFLLSITSFVQTGGATDVSKMMTLINGIIGIIVAIVSFLYACVLMFNEGFKNSWKIPDHVKVVYLGETYRNAGRKTGKQTIREIMSVENIIPNLNDDNDDENSSDEEDEDEESLGTTSSGEPITSEDTLDEDLTDTTNVISSHGGDRKEEDNESEKNGEDESSEYLDEDGEGFQFNY